MEILIATNNKNKIRELKEILSDINNLEIKALDDFNINIDVEETAKTFEENALKKAKEIAKIANVICIADDSGLCIEALNGEPGVKTKRFLGEQATDADRNQYYISKLEGLQKQNRKAKVVTAIAIVDPINNKSEIFIGEMNGYISFKERGENGFAFDKVVEIEDGRTLAELSSEEKNAISSRKQALEKLKKYIEKNYK